MAYKYLNDNGLKAYTKKVKGALKDLHTPIAISTENTTESKAQNVRNIADFVAKAKAAGIADVNGMVVSCIIDNDYSGVGYLYGATDTYICGIISYEDISTPCNFAIDSTGQYIKTWIVTDSDLNIITSQMLAKGARRPIILTPDTTEVDEETYQKLFPNGITTNDVDVMFRIGENDYGLFLPLKSSSIHDGEGYNELGFVGISYGYNLQGTFFHGYYVEIDTGTPHQCNVTELPNKSLNDILSDAGYLNKSTLSPVLKEIDLIGTDAERKAKLAQFETDWKNLTGASDMAGARFVGYYSGESSDPGNNETALSAIMVYDSNEGTYKGFTIDDSGIIRKVDLGSDGDFGAYNLFSDVAAIKYSYTPVPLTTTTSTNKTQLDLFLSKVPDAQIMHCTYKDVYAGTLHKINGSWYGVLVGESNTLAGQLSIKLQADGTIVEGTA